MDYDKRRKELMDEMDANAQAAVAYTNKNALLQKEFRELGLREQRERREKKNVG